MERHLQAYYHRVQYYETDAMGIVHHSNYLRFLEEARNDFTDKSGVLYALVEEEGFYCLVTKSECKYHQPAHYGETLKIITKLTSYNGVRLVYSYRIEDSISGELKLTGTTEHCFVRRDGAVAALKKDCRKHYDSLCAMVGVIADA